MAEAIQRISANAVKLSPEANFSLFHSTIEFSLYKCSPPSELVPLGDRLSKKRRELAEEGSFHIFARRLGILFEEVLPPVPSLLKAYGTRASEIVAELDHVRPPASIANGLFRPHLGVDSTSIWAGATSGPSGLTMHLLACLLARIWSPQEATAIWSELIDYRRQMLKDQGADNKASNFLARQIAMYDADWDTIQGWDSSARSWLQIADNSSRRRHQKQIELIANNLSIAVQSQVSADGTITLSVPGKENVYDSVIVNFRRALEAMENLIAGRPQRILDGGVLLGLTSWHLYPDLLILGPRTQEVSQKDPLVSESGIATLSLSYHDDPNGNQDGVYWSLPLANLRYYGTVQLTDILKAVWTSGHSMYQDTLRQIHRHTLQKAMQAARPSAKQDAKSNLPPVVEKDTVLEDWRKLLRSCMSALHILSPLSGGIDAFMSDDKDEKGRAMQLIRYGFNSARGWIGSSDVGAMPDFGLTDPAFLLRSLRDSASRVRVLRALCAPLLSQSDAFIIRLRIGSSWVFASLIDAESSCSKKRTWSQFESESWGASSALQQPQDEEWVFIQSKNDLPDPLVSYDNNYDLDSLQPGSQDSDFLNFLQTDWGPHTTVVWELVAGIHNLAAVYVRHDRTSSGKARPLPTVPLALVRDLVNDGSLQSEVTLKFISNFFATKWPQQRFSLATLGRIVDYYKCYLPHITLSMGVIRQPPESWVWASSLVQELEMQHEVAASQATDGLIATSIYPSPLTRQQALASILQFESGNMSAEVHELDSVMAISSGNSLFVAQRILHDPIPPEGLASCAVVHAIGNIGRPGIALLFAPDEPNVREHDLEKWHVVNHNPFNGTSAGGTFEGSSLQMSFTGWAGPLRIRGPSGFRGMEVYNLETRVSMYDCGEWVADLNIFEALGSPNLRTCGLLDRPCSHDPLVTGSGVELVSIDCWEELLIPADRPMVFRSGSVWMARMAAVCIAHSRGFKCFLLPVDKTFCWGCVFDDVNIQGMVGQKVLFVY